MEFLNNFLFALGLIPLELFKTIYMVVISSFISCFLGFSLGIFALIAIDGNAWMRTSSKIIKLLLSFFVSVPFSILIVFLFPLTRLVVGTSLGATASIVPLTIGTVPFVARMFLETCIPVHRNLREVALSMRASPFQTIFRIVFPECLPSLIIGCKSIIISIIGFSALAGFVGGGGLGQLIMQYGYYRFNPSVVISVVVVTFMFVESVHFVGNFFADRLLKKRGLF